MILYYSGCGNSRYVAKELARRMGQELRFIPDELNGTTTYTIKENEPIGFVFPIYAWSAPEIVKRFVKQMKVVTNEKPYVFMVCTCGDSIGNADKIFGRLIHSKGWELNAAISVTMPETYINLPGFKLDDTDNERRKLDEAHIRIPQIATSLNDRKNTLHVVRGKAPWLTSSLVNWLFEKLLITDKRFRVKPSCVGCGMCAEVCPMKNITMEPSPKAQIRLRPTWHGNCLNCMACYHHCPKNAIQWSKGTEGKGQYIAGQSLAKYSE